MGSTKLGSRRRVGYRSKWAGVGAAVLAGLMAWPALGQIVTPSDHPGSLPGQPTSSMILGSNLANVQSWWASPLYSVQTTWKNNINSRANSSVTLATPSNFSEAAAQSQIVQARAFRWLMNPSAATAAGDLASVIDVLSNYARVTGGSSITNPEVAQNYYQAFDFINAGLSDAERAAITSRLSGSNVQGALSNPFQINNQQLKQASTRALGALLFNNDSEIDTQLGRIRSSLNTNSTNDGGYTDGLRYLNYGIAQFAPLTAAYATHTGISMGPQVEQFVKMALGVRMPNGLTPSAHNNDNAAVAIAHFSSLISDPGLKAAALWNVTALPGHDWTTYTNVVNNDWTYTDFFALTDFSVTPAAPTWSPVFFSGGQAQAATFRNDWSTASHFINLSAGIDGASFAGFTHHDTGGLTVVAHGTQVLVEPGYNRTGLGNTPSGFDSSRATEHNILLARDAGTSSWGIGNGTSQTNTGATVTTTNRLDSAERGDFKGVTDFVTLRATYGGSGAGNDVQARRSMAMASESNADMGYFVLADSARRTDATNKDFAVNLIGKSTAANTEIMTNSASYMRLRWAVNDYDGNGYNGGIVINGYPYNQTQNGQVIAHIVVSTNASMAVAQDTTWMFENYNYYQQTQRLRVSASNVSEVAFLTIFELGTVNAPSQFAVTSLSGPQHASARIVNSTAGWTDWIISQTSSTDVHAITPGAQVSIDSGVLSSDAQYAYLRKVGGALNSAMISRGTNLFVDGAQLLGWSDAVTASVLFDTGLENEIRGTLSADDLAANTILTIFTANLLGDFAITSATLNGAAMAFTNDGPTGTVTMAGAGGGEFVILFEPLEAPEVPEPAGAVLLILGGVTLLGRRRF